MHTNHGDVQPCIREETHTHPDAPLVSEVLFWDFLPPSSTPVQTLYFEFKTEKANE